MFVERVWNKFLWMELRILVQIKNKEIDTIELILLEKMEFVSNADFHKNQSNLSLGDLEFFYTVSNISNESGKGEWIWYIPREAHFVMKFHLEVLARDFKKDTTCWAKARNQSPFSIHKIW